MYTKTVMVTNPTGLHARPASIFITEAKRYKSSLTIRNISDKEGNTVNAKSIVHLLTLAAGPGNEVEITATGEDEVQAVEGLVTLIRSGFGEQNH